MNLTNDGNSTFATKEPYDRVFNRPAFLFIYVLIFVPSAVCNGLACWIVKRNPSMHTNTNYMLINLAIADLLATVLSIFQVVDYLAVNLYLDNIACKFRGSLVYICHGSSVFTLTAIAHDRYIAICHPLARQRNNYISKVKLIIAQIWLLAVVVHIPSMIYCSSQINEYKQSSCSCFERFPSKRAAATYAILRYSIVYVVPAIVVTRRYTAIIVRLRQPPPGQTQSSSAVYRGRKGVVKMLMASSIFFFLAWTPFYTLYLLRDTSVNTRDVFRFVWYPSMLLALCNCAYNPVIYCLLSRNFRQGFKIALCWCYRGVSTSQIQSFRQQGQM